VIFHTWQHYRPLEIQILLADEGSLIKKSCADSFGPWHSEVNSWYISVPDFSLKCARKISFKRTNDMHIVHHLEIRAKLYVWTHSSNNCFDNHRLLIAWFNFPVSFCLDRLTKDKLSLCLSPPITPMILKSRFILPNQHLIYQPDLLRGLRQFPNQFYSFALRPHFPAFSHLFHQEHREEMKRYTERKHAANCLTPIYSVY
jgi:hypothetical protein